MNDKHPAFPAKMKSVEILTFPDVQILDVTGPLQVFASANELFREKGSQAPYDLKVVARSGEPTACSAGVRLVTQALPETHLPPDTLIIPGGRGVDAAAKDSALVTWIRGRAESARRTASVCTGAFLMAETGLFAGRRVATHWERSQELASRYPDMQVDPVPIFIRDGPLWSSAGVTAGIDLCLALVEEDLGHDVALGVARDLVVHLKRSGGQPQYSALLALQGSSRFSRLHDWLQEHLEEELTLSRLAERCGMSERSFSRRYVEETGVTPSRAVERLRIEAARALLSGTDLPIKSVAKRCGFASEDTLRRSFFRLLETSPQEYRRNWKASERR